MQPPGWGHAHAPADKGGVPGWVWVVIAVALMGLLGFGGCLVAVGVLASRAPPAERASSAEPIGVDEGFIIVRADAAEEPGDVFRAAAVTARARALHPFVLATASWCEPCQRLEASMKDPRMKRAFRGTYVVEVDIDDFGSKSLSAAGVDVRAVPSVYELGPDGTPTGRMMIGDWGPDTPENMAPALERFFGAPR